MLCCGYVLVYRLSQVDNQHAELSWEKSCICRVMHGNELHNQTTIHVVNDGVYWLNVLRKISNVFLFFFPDVFANLENDLRT